MQLAQNDLALRQEIMDETLFTAVSFGLPHMFNIEWLIDKAERGEWSGLWW
ncbi:hypothetical protein [uncultured Tateyamaria sp.]|uniref:hypothetical protein n=1 Tax=uncultured Tateyamaria sp. TaxID=455651 RepID=UPI0026315C61|nr:hypothetical protein [uncultured Tateyamaria sp.]